MQLFDYIFNVGGNYTATINGMTEATGDFSAKVESANNWVGKILLRLPLLIWCVMLLNRLTAQ